MKVIIQRVLQASVLVHKRQIAKIENGALLLVGFHQEDQKQAYQLAAKKIVEMRYFSDENGKMNQSILDVQGELLVVSQFTLLATTNRGRRPDFLEAMPPQKAAQFFDDFVAVLRKSVPTQTGEFGKHMEVSLVNDGPVTFSLEF